MKPHICGPEANCDDLCDRAHHEAKVRRRAIHLLKFWRDQTENTDEHRETFAYLKRSLDEVSCIRVREQVPFDARCYVCGRHRYEHPSGQDNKNAPCSCPHLDGCVNNERR